MIAYYQIQGDEMKKTDAKKVHIGHVCIEVSSIKRSRKFYDALMDALGFGVIMEMEDVVGYGNGDLGLFICAEKKPRIKRSRPRGDEFVIADHIAFFLQNRTAVDRITKKLKDKGYEPLFPPEEHPEFRAGYYSSTFCDPDNCVIELYTAPGKRYTPSD